MRRVALSYFAFRYGSSHLFCSGGVGWGVMGFVMFRYGSWGEVRYVMLVCDKFR